MVKVYSIDGVTPVVHPEAFVHPSAVLIGDVHVGAGVYIGPSASLRGDFGRIIVEAGANIQDCCVLHCAPDCETVIEQDGHIGHSAVIHGARICRNALIGISAVINDNAVVGESAIVAALAFVKAKMQVPPRSLAAGVPAKVVRELSADEMEWKAGATRVYQNLAQRSRASLRETVALTEAEPGRKRLPPLDVMTLSAWKEQKARG